MTHRAPSAPSAGAARGLCGLGGGSQGQSHDTFRPVDVTGSNRPLHELTERVEVAACQAAQVKVQVLQLREVGKVLAETLQSPRQTFVARQVQLSY